MRLGANTTKNMPFYDAHSKTIMQNRLRMSRGGIFVIRENDCFFHDSHSKMVLLNCLRMYDSDISVIRGNVNDDDFI